MSPATCAIYLLRVPEFEAVARALAALDGVSLAPCGDYHVARAAGEIVLRRESCGVGHAVWFGALTGGIAGRIVEFSDDTLRLAPIATA